MAQQDVGGTSGVAGTNAPSAARVFGQQSSSPGQQTTAVQEAAAAGEVQQQHQPHQHSEYAAASAARTAPQQQQTQQQQQQAWLAAWQQDQATGSSGSGGSLGAFLGQIIGGFPAPDVPNMDVLGLDQMLAAGSWQTESRLADSRGTSPLDVLGRPVGHATLPQQPLSRQTSVPVSGAQYGTTNEARGSYRPSSAGAQYSMMSLPASPTMLQHQLQLQLRRASVSTSHSISPSTGSWPDVEMEQPLAPQAATVAAENGDALLWPSGAMGIPPSSSPQLLHQVGMPLGLQLRLPAEQQRQLAAAAAVAGQRQQQQVDAALLQKQQPAGAAVMVLQQQQQQYTGRTSAQTADQQLLQHQLDDQALMPPPLPVPPGSTADRSSTAPRPPPLIIPSSQPQQLPAHQHLGASSAPTPSPAQPRSGTSITPVMLSMGLADATTAGFTGHAANAEAAAVQQEDGASAPARPRRQRRRASVPSSPAVTGSLAVSASPQVLTGAAALLAAGRHYVKVVCGSLHGWLDLTDMLVQVAAGQGHDECKLTPSGFECLAGKGATRKWRQSLTALPDGPTDPWISEPMPIGDFMKQHMIDKASIPTMHRAPSSSAADEVSAVDPAAAAAAMRYHPLVSPGVRRRRSQQQLQGAFTGQLQVHQDVQVGAEDADQVQAHVKRSRGSTVTQQPIADAWHAPDLAAVPAAVQDQQQQLQLALTSEQTVTPEEQLQAMIAAVPAAAAASSIAAVGQQGLQFPQQQLQLLLQQQRGDAGTGQLPQQRDVMMGQIQQLPQILPSLPWGSQNLQQQIPAAVAAASGAGIAATADAAAAAPGLKLEHEHPAVLSSLADSQQGLSQQLLTPGSQPGSQHSGSQQSSQQGTQGTPTDAAAAAPGPDASVKPLLSPAGRPIRQPSISRHRAASATASSRHDRSGQPVGFVGGIRHLQVWCDQLPGILDLNKMQVFPQEGEFQGQPMSLSAFEQLGGRGIARKWRRSLTTLDGTDHIALGEWMERYQILPGSEGKHISPKPSPKPRATTPPSAGAVMAAQAAAAAAGGGGGGYGSWQGSRDQHGSSRKQSAAHSDNVIAAPLHRAAMGSSAAAIAQQQKAGRRKVPQAGPQAASGRLPPMPAGRSPAAGASAASAAFTRRRSSSPAGDAFSPHPAAAAAAAGLGGGLGVGPLDTRCMPRDSSGGQAAAAQPHPAQQQKQRRGASATVSPVAAAATGEPVNPDLLMMLTEYASEYSHPELHLHPAQVEQDLADLPAGNATSGLFSPRLGSMDWQSSPSKQQLLTLPPDIPQPQQPGMLSPAAAAVGGGPGGAAAAADVPFSPASLLDGPDMSGQDIMAAFSSQGELEPSQSDTLGPTQ